MLLPKLGATAMTLPANPEARLPNHLRGALTRLVVAMLAATALATLPPAAPPATADPAPTTPQGSYPDAAEQQRIRDFWTPEKMKEADANPLSLDKVPGVPGDALPPAPAQTPEPPDVGTHQRWFPDPPSEAELRGQIPAINGKLRFRYDRVDGPGTGVGSCSGNVVQSLNRSVVATAAHCLQNFGGTLHWDFQFVPAHDNRSVIDVFGSFIGGPVYVPGPWQDGTDISAIRQLDYGALVVSRNEGGTTLVDAVGILNAVVPMGIDPATGEVAIDEDSRALILGYPSGDENALNYCRSRPKKSAAEGFRVVYAACTMGQGSSGGGWYQFQETEDHCFVFPRLIAVTSYGPTPALTAASIWDARAAVLYLEAQSFRPTNEDFDPGDPPDPQAVPKPAPPSESAKPQQAVCPVPAPSEVYVPTVRSSDSPLGGSMRTGLQIFNPAGSQAEADLLYVRENGDKLPVQKIRVPANGSLTITEFLDPATGLKIPDNFAGSAYIAVTNNVKGLSAAVNHIVNGTTLSSSNAGVLINGAPKPAAEPSYEVRMPLLMRGQGSFTTWYTVQNTTPRPASVTAIYSFNVVREGRTVPFTETREIPPYASAAFRQADATGSPSVFSGTIQSTEPVIANVFQQGDQLMEYAAFGINAGSPSSAAPLVMANNFGSFTGVQVQNAGTQATQITLTYGRDTSGDKADDGTPARYGGDAPKGSCGTPSPASTDPDPTKYVQPGDSVTFLQTAPIKGPDGTVIGGYPFFERCAYIGSATITSNNGQPLVTVVNQLNSGAGFGSTYEAKWDLKPTAEMPLVQSRNFGTNGGVQIQNAGPATKVKVTFNRNTAPPRDDAKGQLPPCPGFPSSRTIDMGASTSKTYVLPDQWPELKFDPGEDPGVGCTYIGSVTATAVMADGNTVNPNGRLSGILNQTSPYFKRDLLSTYTAG